MSAAADFLPMLAGAEIEPTFDVEVWDAHGPSNLQFGLAEAIAEIEESPESGVYLSPTIRTAGDERRAWCLSVVCDGPGPIAALERFEPTPGAIIDPGDGSLQAVWPLTESVSVEELADANARLAAALGASRASVDQLNAPGSMNLECDPPANVAFSGDGAARPLRDVIGRLPNHLVAVDAARRVTTPAELMREKRRAKLPLTDYGNAERLVIEHGHELRHATGIGWLVWDGRRWQRDPRGKDVTRRMKATVRTLRAEAADLEQGDASKRLFAHADKSEQSARLAAAIGLAESEIEVDAEPADFDADPLLLNVKNGTIDLRTGKLRGHNPGDLITRLAPVEFDADADCPMWLRFLTDVFDEDAELIAYAQRAVGYSLTGETGEQCLFMPYGLGANGKSTFIETVAALLGDYTEHADAASFTTGRAGSVRTDLAKLAGARFVPAVEIEADARMAEVLVKQLTGGDEIVARKLYQDEFTFRPAFKLWLAVNHLPEVRGDEHAIWRRIRVLPFDVTITRPDQTMPAKLRAELPGILNWALAGCLEWRENGLGQSGRIDDATARYRADSDPLRHFLDACCVVEAGARVDSADLWTAYSEWAERKGIVAVTRKSFGVTLASHGFEAGRTKQGRFWTGIALEGVTR